jgi:hydrogenase maturation protease
VSLHIIGCGNIDRGDDAAGLLVARRLRALAAASLFVAIAGVEISGLVIMEQSGESFSLMDCWTVNDDVILVDATAPRGTPGQVQLWNAHADQLPEDIFSCSTHAFGVREAVELARTMSGLPRTLLIYGIEGKQFFHGAPPSPEVERAVESVANELMMRLTATSARRCG